MPGASSDPPTLARVELAAVRANFAEARRRAGGRAVIAVVKADAYGHGAAPVARALVEAGCRQLAVASLEEACALREAGVAQPLLVLGGVGADPELALEYGLTPVLHHRGQLEELARAARARGARARVHVEVDSGMHRMGVPPEQGAELLAATAAEPALELEGAFTHLARGDEPELAPTLEQLRVFREVLAAARAHGAVPAQVHCAHSAGLLAGKPLFEALPEANAVRPGLMLYGVRPAPHLEASLRPVMTLRTRVVQLRSVQPGRAVGYAALWQAPRATRVATLAIGYADGVPLATSNRGQVLIGGRRHPIVGRVSMDYVTVDVGDARVGLGDEAVLFGRGAGGELPVEEAAEAAGTLAYELLVRVGGRVPRVYS